MKHVFFSGHLVFKISIWWGFSRRCYTSKLNHEMKLMKLINLRWRSYLKSINKMYLFQNFLRWLGPEDLNNPQNNIAPQTWWFWKMIDVHFSNGPFSGHMWISPRRWRIRSLVPPRWKSPAPRPRRNLAQIFRFLWKLFWRVCYLSHTRTGGEIMDFVAPKKVMFAKKNAKKGTTVAHTGFS